VQRAPCSFPVGVARADRDVLQIYENEVTKTEIDKSKPIPPIMANVSARPWRKVRCVVPQTRLSARSTTANNPRSRPQNNDCAGDDHPVPTPESDLIVSEELARPG
jgi:hypothetical protein